MERIPIPLLVRRTATYVKRAMPVDLPGHDWWHIRRVWRMSLRIVIHEPCDTRIVQLSALLHDLDDWKVRPRGTVLAQTAHEWLASQGMQPGDILRISRVIQSVSYRGVGETDDVDSIEAAVVQDADRLDAIGAIGIARAFAYGAAAGLPMHLPHQPPREHTGFEDYRHNRSSTVNHFYEKLLRLRDRMKTRTGMRIAAERHAATEVYLRRFLAEWDGRDAPC